MGLLARGRLRWRSVDQEVNRDQQGDRDQEAIDIVISDQVCDRDRDSVGYATRSATRRATAIG